MWEFPVSAVKLSQAAPRQLEKRGAWRPRCGEALPPWPKKPRATVHHCLHFSPTSPRAVGHVTSRGAAAAYLDVGKIGHLLARPAEPLSGAPRARAESDSWVRRAAAASIFSMASRIMIRRLWCVGRRRAQWAASLAQIIRRDGCCRPDACRNQTSPRTG